MIQKSISNTRIAFLDAAKAVAIFLVVWGHLIQQTDADFWNNDIFAFIYSFHIPLFFLLSGMFLDRLFSLSFLHALKKRAIQLLLPATTIALIGFVIRLLLAGTGISIIDIAETIVKAVVCMPWFCKTLFCCNMIAYIAKRCFKTDCWACVGSILLLHLIPNDDYFALKTFLPFVWCGYFLMKYRKTVFDNAAKILPPMLLAYIILLCFWNTDCTFYKTSSTLWTINLSEKEAAFLGRNLSVELYRFAIGLSGAMSVILSIKLLYEKTACAHPSLIAYIGSNTLGIYLLQTFGESWLFKQLSPVNELFTPPAWVPSAIILPICAIGTILLITLLIYLIRKNKYSSLLLLGDNKAFL